jgi:2-C-methyl-D-erythritol 2,4-cyclodiphosphate synthase
MRIGHGYDVHRYEEGRDLILGVVKIPYEKGLAAHSDGDAVIHALCDALLGAAGLGDIGTYFPDTDSSYQGMDSRIFLKDIRTMLDNIGYQVSNADVTIIAQAPKMLPHVSAMKTILAEDLGINIDQINIKATTTEGMGYIGKKEGIAVHAIALIKQI